MRLVVTLERDETGMIVAECPAIPGGGDRGVRRGSSRERNAGDCLGPGG